MVGILGIRNLPYHLRVKEVFTFPSWPEINSMGKIPWNCNDGKTANAMNIDTSCVLSGPQKMVSMSTTPSLLGGSVERQGLRSEGHGMQASLSQPHTNYGTVYHHHHSEDVQLAARLNHVLGLQSACNGPRMSQSQIDGRIQALPRGLQEAAHDILQRLSRGSSRLPKLARSPSMCSSGSEISSCQQLSSDSQSVAPLRHHTYTGGIFPSPFGLGHSNAESLRLPEGTPFELHHLRKRPWDDEARVSPQESMFNTSDRGQAPQIRSVGQHSHSQGAAVVVAGTARPRTRARRGQATDPHSIAERLRRERIAVRMKALQELVASSNKFVKLGKWSKDEIGQEMKSVQEHLTSLDHTTSRLHALREADKASLLDDIIEYVKFLQLQAKVFSISRLGGTGAVAPLVADISAEGHSSFEAAMFPSTGGATGALQDYHMDVTEEEVLKLMEVDMGSAMRFLQTKGMCLMPISLATAISRKDARHSTGYTRAID